MTWRNRHGLTCQGPARDRWLEARRAEWLPIPYFPVVFTLPQALNALAQGNPRLLYTLVFRTATDTLLAFGRAPQHVGGTIGVTAILHTWGPTLTQHLHLHGVVTGGALSPDGMRCLPARRRFLFPVRALATVFRAKYLEAIQTAYETRRLTFAGGTAPLAHPIMWRRFLHGLHAQPWVVYAEPPFGGPEGVLAHLARDTHRVAITNARLIDLVDGVVRFRWKDDADHDRVKVMALDGAEFLRRFPRHVVPSRFVRIRHAGLFGNHHRHARLARCRAHLHVSRLPAPAEPHTAPVAPAPDRCPVCHQGATRVTAILASLVEARHWPRAPVPP